MMKRKFIFIPVLLVLVGCGALLAACGSAGAVNFPDAVFTDKTVTYDGTEHEITVSGAPKGAVITYAQNRASDVGTYRAFVHIAKDGKERVMSAVLTVEKIDLTGIAFADAGTVYDGGVKSIAVSGNVPGDVDVVYTADGQPFGGASEAGVYNVTATLSGNNYRTKTLHAMLDIAKAEIPNSVRFPAQSTFTYNGEVRMLTVSGLPRGASVVYTDGNGAAFNGAVKPRAGGYGITAHIDGGRNYKDKTLSATLTINKARIRGAAFVNKTVLFDGTPHKFGVTGLPEGVSVTYMCFDGGFDKVNGEATAVGTYSVYATLHGGECYEDLELSATLRITEDALNAPAGLSVSADNKLLEWQPAADAGEYYVYVYSAGGDILHVITDKAIKATSFEINKWLIGERYLDGEYSFRVSAAPKSTGGAAESVPSEAVGYTLTNGKLHPPTNVRVEGGYLKWDGDDRAMAYEIQIEVTYAGGTVEVDNGEQGSMSCSMTVDSVAALFGKGAGVYRFAVSAYPGSIMPNGTPALSQTLYSDFSEYTDYVTVN